MIPLTIIKYACFANCVPLYTRGVYLRYDDLQDAAEGKDILEQHGFQVVYVTGYQYALAKAQDTAQLNEFEGQMSLTVLIDANPEHAIWEFSEADYALMQLAIQNVCSAFGRVRNLVHVSTDNAKMSLTFRVEFSSVDSAGRAVQSLAMDPVWGINLAVSCPPSPCLALLLTLSQKSFQWVTSVALPWTGNRATNSLTATSLVSMTKVASSGTVLLSTRSRLLPSGVTQLISTTVSVVSVSSMAATFAPPSCFATYPTRWTGFVAPSPLFDPH
jgi:hypothetical protein